MATREKRQKDRAAQPQLPSLLQPRSPGTTLVLPMQLQIGDRLADETGEWEAIGRPFTKNCGRTVHIRVPRASGANTTQIRTWDAHEKVSVRRATTKEGKR